MSDPRLRLLGASLGCLVFAAAVATFWPGVTGEFLTWDDRDNIVTNAGVHGLGRAQLAWMWSGVVLGHYIPLTWMSFGLNYALGGLNPWGYHVLNLLLHGANAALFFLVARRLLAAARPGGGDPTPAAQLVGAAFAALLFAIHPLRVESVVWITERKDVLCGLFFLSAVLAYLKAVEGPALDRRWQVISLAAFSASLLAKAASMPLPALLLLLDVYPLGRARALGWRRVLREKVPWAVLGLTGALTALAAVYSGPGVTDYHRYGPGARLAMTAYTFVFYPARWFWPVHLVPLYELPMEVHVLAPRFLLPAVAFVAVTAGLVALRRAWPAGLAAWTASVVMLLPISGAVHSGHQLAHDRYSYLSGLGLALLAGGGLARLLDARARGRISAVIARSVTVGAVLVVLVLAAGAWDQSKVWADSETLWRWSVNVDPDCSVCWNNLGAALTGRERHLEAEAAYRRVAALRPMTASLANNIATALAGQRKDADAEAMLREALRLDPSLTGALLNLGSYEAQTGRFAEALAHLRKAYALDPRFSGSVKELAQALVAAAAAERKAGRPNQAMALYQEALAVQPGSAQARIGVEALSAGRPADGLRR